MIASRIRDEARVPLEDRERLRRRPVLGSEGSPPSRPCARCRRERQPDAPALVDLLSRKALAAYARPPIVRCTEIGSVARIESGSGTSIVYS